MPEFDLIILCSENHIDPVPSANNQTPSPRRSPLSQLSLTQWSSPLVPHAHQSPSSFRRKDGFIGNPKAATDFAGDITIRPGSRTASQNQSSGDDSATESENESAVVNFIAEIKRKKRLSTPRVDRSPIPIEPVMHDILSEPENSLTSQPVFHSSPSQVNFISSQASAEDTQALYLAGAPPSDFTFPTMDSDESIPPFVKDFLNTFDDDDSSYPSHIPPELRD